MVSVVEVVSVPAAFGAGLADTRAGDGAGEGGGAGVLKLDWAKALTANSTMSAKSKAVFFIMIFPSERFGCR